MKRAVVTVALLAAVLGGLASEQGSQASTRPVHLEAATGGKANRGGEDGDEARAERLAVAETGRTQARTNRGHALGSGQRGVLRQSKRDAGALQRRQKSKRAEHPLSFHPCTKPRMLRIRPKMSHAMVVRRVSALIRCAERHWPVEGGLEKALDVADCESSFAPWADNGNGDLGVYQISAWPERAKTWLRKWMFPKWQQPFPEWSNGRANVLAGIRWAHAKGWGAWACA